MDQSRKLKLFECEMALKLFDIKQQGILSFNSIDLQYQLDNYGPNQHLAIVR